MGTFWSTPWLIETKLSTGTRSHCSSAQLATSAGVMLFKRSMTFGPKPTSLLCTASDKAARSSTGICLITVSNLLPANDLSWFNWFWSNLSQTEASLAKTSGSVAIRSLTSTARTYSVAHSVTLAFKCWTFLAVSWNLLRLILVRFALHWFTWFTGKSIHTNF